MLSVRLNCFQVCTACTYQKYQIKMQILTINNKNFELPPRNSSNRTKVKILETIFLIAHQNNLVPHMLSHCENVRTSKFWQKSKEKNPIFFNRPRAYKVLIFSSSKKIQIISCLCTFKLNRRMP